MCETKREGGSGETHREERETVWEEREREGERQRKVRESERDSERKSDSERVKEGES